MNFRPVFFLPILLMISLLVGCGDDPDFLAAGRSMTYDHLIKNCEKGIPQAKKVLAASDIDVDLDMMLVATYVGQFKDDIEFLLEGQKGELADELRALLKEVVPHSEEADGLSHRSVEIIEKARELYTKDPQSEEAFKMEKEWLEAQRKRAATYLKLFETTGEKLKALRDRDPDYIAG